MTYVNKTKRENDVKEPSKDLNNNRIKDLGEMSEFEKLAKLNDDEVSKQINDSVSAGYSTKKPTSLPEWFINKYTNLHFEWMIYDPSNIDVKKQQGWVVVEDEKLAAFKSSSTGSIVTISAGQANNKGEAEMLVLMAIRKELKDKHNQLRLEKAKAIKAKIESGVPLNEDVPMAKGDKSGFYSKDNFIAIS